MSLELNGKSVLLIEDDSELRFLMAKILQKEKYNVIEASNGHHAMQLLESSGCPDLILLDLMMPQMDGAEFLVQIKNHPKCAASITVIVSGHDDIELRAKKAGANGYVRKPIDLNTLIMEVNRHLL